MPADQPVFGDRYQLVRHIARGGMAQVYLARDLLLDRPVALKVLFPELSVDEAFVERFRREAQAAANLSHPNIVSIYDWGQGERTYYIVMEYVDGETLSARIRRAPLAPDQAAIVAIATASALAFAHRRNVIHRDVKPGNVLIDRSGQVKVADFGIARAVGAAENLTQAGSVMGTATYFSPEQAQGLAVDARSDVYSLGVVLYEMVVGKPPFQGDNPVAIAYKHVRERPDAPTTRNPAIPAAFEAIVMQALAKDPARRYQSADELRFDLERFRAGQPVLAASPGAADATGVVGRVGPDATAVLGGAAIGAAVGTDPTRVVPRATDPTVVAGRRRVVVAGPPGPPPPGPDEDPFDEPRSRTGLYVALLVVLLLVLGVLGYVIGKDLGLFGSSTKNLTVPNVAGEPAATAKAKLVTTGFTDVGERLVTSGTVKDGDVVATTPAAGASAAANAPVTLEVSGGAGQVAMPSVAGDTEAAALARLSGAGLKPTTSTQASNTVTKGDVIATRPAAGQPVARGSSVEVIVSSGPASVLVPSLTGASPATAGATLERDGFKVASASEASSTVQAGSVTRTYPAGGSSAPYGSTVTVYTSTGQATVTVPPLTGDTKTYATQQLDALGLVPSFTTTPVATPYQDNRVQSTAPVAGQSVPKGSTVTLVIGTYTAPSTTTTTTPASTTTTTTPTGSTTTTPTTTTPGATGLGNGRRTPTAVPPG